MITEVLRQEEMPVLLILIGRDIIVGGLGASFHRHAGGFAFLFRIHRCHGGTSEFELCLQTKKALASGDQCTVEGEGDITGFDQL